MKYSKMILILTTLISFNAQAAIGFLSQVSGDVTINGVKAKSGDPVKLNSEIQTKADGKLQIMVGDAMVAVVGFNSQVQVEKYEASKAKMKVTNKEIQNEKLQLNLKSGSLRMLVAKNDNAIRMATVRSGDAFGIVQDGEAHFKSTNGNK